jgi:hypothetical protein
MNSIDTRGYCWPTQEQELLLKAALLRGQEALDAWDTLQSNLDIAQLDQGSLRMLPLLYKNVDALGVDSTLSEELKGYYRFTWYKNQMLFHSMAETLRAFHDAGIQTMILKGAALILLYYRNYSLRPMGDFDVLVHTEDASSAVDLLKDLGWGPRKTLSKGFLEKILAVRHSHNFNDAAGQGFDLHRHLLLECCYADADDAFWESALSVQFHDVPTCALNPTDQLFHVCAHGVRWELVSPIRWIADAMTILDTSGNEIDWNRLVAQAESRHLTLPTKDALDYLHDKFKAPIPREVRQCLERIKTTKREQAEYSIVTQQRGVMGLMPLHWYHYLRQTEARHWLPKLLGFPRYLMYEWGKEHMGQVFLHIAIRGVERIWHRIVGHADSSNRRPDV